MSDAKRIEQMQRIQRLEQIKRIQSLEQQKNAPAEEEQEEAGTFGKALNTMDLSRIPGAAALAKGLEKVSGKDVYRPEDYASPISKGVPSSYDLLERAGYGGSDDPTDMNPITNKFGRQAGGFALDAITDVGTWATLGENQIAKLLAKTGVSMKNSERFARVLKGATSLPGEVIEQVGKGSAAAGKKVYKSAFKNLDNAAEKAAAKNGTAIPKDMMPSEIMLERGAPAAWTARGMKEKVTDVSKGIIRDRNAILDAGLGDDFDFDRMYAGLKEKARELIRSGHDAQIERGKQILQKIEDQRVIYEGLPEIRSTGTPDQIRQVETGLLSEFGEPILKDVVVPGEPIRIIQQAVPPRKVTPSSLQQTKQIVGSDMPDVFSGKSNLEKEIANAEYGGIKDEVEAISANPAEVRRLNKQASMLFPTESPQVSLAIAEEMKNPTNTMNMLLTAMNPQIGLSKQGLDILLRQGIRAKTGKAMMKTGEGVLKYNAPIRVLTNPLKPSTYSPWDINVNEENKE